MSSSRTPRYVVSFTTVHPTQFHTGIEWKTDVHGQPNENNLIAFCTKYEESTQSGGCNEHLGPMAISEAKLVDQKTSKVLAEAIFAS
jgi:hypothetical protein